MDNNISVYRAKTKSKNGIGYIIEREDSGRYRITRPFQSVDQESLSRFFVEEVSYTYEHKVIASDVPWDNIKKVIEIDEEAEVRKRDLVIAEEQLENAVDVIEGLCLRLTRQPVSSTWKKLSNTRLNRIAYTQHVINCGRELVDEYSAKEKMKTETFIEDIEEKVEEKQKEDVQKRHSGKYMKELITMLLPDHLKVKSDKFIEVDVDKGLVKYDDGETSITISLDEIIDE